MWSSDRRKLLKLLVAAPALAALSACGFTPAYGPGGGGDRLLNVTRIPEPDSGDSYILVRALEQRLGRAASPVYDLTLKLRSTENRIAVTSDNIATRFNVAGELTYTLSNAGTGARISSGKVSSFTGYSATGTTVATQASQRDAHARLMQILADMLIARLITDVAATPADPT